MKSSDKTTTIQELKDLVIKYRDDRGWNKHHSHKNLAISIALEAAELMEHFQWDDDRKEDKQGMADELADILIYCYLFADKADIDISTAFKHKLDKAIEKYPVSIFSKDGNLEEYHKVKQSYRAKK